MAPSREIAVEGNGVGVTGGIEAVGEKVAIVVAAGEEVVTAVAVGDAAAGATPAWRGAMTIAATARTSAAVSTPIDRRTRFRLPPS